jgi:RNA polymerase sigma-70 factor (ECF subfamily)
MLLLAGRRLTGSHRPSHQSRLTSPRCIIAAMPPEDTSAALVSGSPRFATTRWSIVAAAGARASPDARAALTILCETYWYPVYAFVRRRGSNAEDARELTQEFFATLIEKEYLRAADSDRGRFRSFLLTAVKRFLSKQRERDGALKRGGGQKPMSLDFEAGEARYRLEPSHDWTPERIFERRWALTLLDRVVERLAEEYAARGKSRLFEQLKTCLTDPADAPKYAQIAAELQMSEGAVKVAAHRLRSRYREILKAEVAETLADPAEAGEELRELLQAVGGGSA